MKRKLLSILLTLCMMLTLLPTVALADEGGSNPAANSIDFATFLTALNTAKGESDSVTFDGSTHTKAANGKLTVKWSPTSGCYHNVSGHTCVCTEESKTPTGNTPNRLQSTYAQYQVLSDTKDVSISNVNFVYVPAEVSICTNTTNNGWGGQNVTPALAEIQLQNSGNTTFTNCSFDKVTASPFGKGSTAGNTNEQNTATFTSCSFSNITNKYAIKDIHAGNVTVESCIFTDCGGGIYLEGTANKGTITIENNSFANIGDKGLIQFSANGNYSNSTITLSGNSAANCEAVLRQLNSSAVNQIYQESNWAEITGLAATGSIFVDGSTEAVASITNDRGTTYYDTLAEAVSAATNGDTITLLKNVTLSAGINIDKTVTIDLAGYSVMPTNGFSVYDKTTNPTGYDYLLAVKRGGTLTINDTSAGKTGKIDVNNNGGIYCAIKMTVSGEDENGAVASLTVNSGTIIGYYYGIFGNGGRHNTSITINGGTIYGTATDDNLAIFHPQNGTLTITGGIFNGYLSAIEMRGGTLNISGGTFKSTATTYSCNANGSGTTTVGAAIAIAPHTTKKDISVTISGGTFEGTHAFNEANPQNNDSGNVTLSITGGTFTGTVNAEGIASGTKFITGGTFSTDPSTYAANGYTSYKNPNGTFGVAQGSSSDKANVTITVTPEDAKVELKKGDTVIGTAAGTYTDLPGGEYKLTVSKAGYQGAEQTIIVAGEAQTISVSLSPSSTSSGVSKYAVTVEETSNGSVTASAKRAAKGATVTITVTPDKGYVLETLTVLDKNGDALELTDNGDGKYSFKMPAGKVTVTATFMDDNTMLNFFVDVPASAYYYEAVLWAAKKEITGGIDDTHFGPDLTCTRAQLVTFLWRAAGCPVVNYAMDFSDVGDDYYTEAVRWAASLGIVGGYGNGLFGTNDEVLREQVVTILYRYAVAMGMDVSVGEDTNILSYNDAFAVSEYAISAFQWATGAGIVQGADGKLMPQEPCTRGQIVTMLYRLLGE